MKQSSIDWLYNNLKSHFEHDGDLLEAVKMSFEQAKATHKEEIENAYWDGGQWVPTSGSQCEEYYNETFNTKEKWTNVNALPPLSLQKLARTEYTHTAQSVRKK